MAKAKKKINTDNPEVRFLPGTVNIETREEGNSRHVWGYAFKYDELSRMIDGWFREKIAPGSLEGCDLSEVIAAVHHRQEFIVARVESGTLRLTADEIGLRYDIDEVPNTTAGNDLIEDIRVKNILGSSFKFRIAVKGDEWEEDDENGTIRTIIKFKKIYDVAPVVNPAYLNTNADLAKRSFNEFKGESEDTPAPFRREMARRRLDLMFNK